MSRPTSVLGNCMLALIVIAAVSCEDPHVALVRGRIASVKGDEIAIVPLQSHGSAPPLELTIDQQKTTILARRVKSGTMKLEPAVRSDLVVGREVAVTTYGREASIIRVFPPKPVGGHVVTERCAKIFTYLVVRNALFWPENRCSFGRTT